MLSKFEPLFVDMKRWRNFFWIS